MNTSNLTPTKLLLGSLLVIIVGLGSFFGFNKVLNSASHDNASDDPLPQEQAPLEKAPTQEKPIMTGFISSIPEKAEEKPFLVFETPHLLKGREIWMANCENCHAWGTAGAPIPMEAAAWKDRVVKDKATLYNHAINGFFGPNDTMMPPRGGNDALSDDDVKAAVDYMLALATHYIDSQPNNQ